jgi:hypothetical protein
MRQETEVTGVAGVQELQEAKPLGLEVKMYHLNRKLMARNQKQELALTRNMVELRVTLTSTNQRVSQAPTGPTPFYVFTQAKAWAEFSWPFGPSASPLGSSEHLGNSAARRAMRA